MADAVVLHYSQRVRRRRLIAKRAILIAITMTFVAARAYMAPEKLGCTTSEIDSESGDIRLTTYVLSFPVWRHTRSTVFSDFVRKGGGQGTPSWHLIQCKSLLVVEREYSYSPSVAACTEAGQLLKRVESGDLRAQLLKQYLDLLRRGDMDGLRDAVRRDVDRYLPE